jgi:hypothetical protein
MGIIEDSKAVVDVSGNLVKEKQAIEKEEPYPSQTSPGDIYIFSIECIHGKHEASSIQ